MKHETLEKNSILLVVAILIAVSIGGIIQIAPLFWVESTIEKVQGMRPYSPLEQAGREIYIREGCYNCHSQMVRTLRDEVERYGHYSLAAESMYDHPFQWGSKRTGPDLARVGGKYSDQWHAEHMIQCALCIDACDAIMDKMERPRGLIAYDTIAMREAAAVGGHVPLRLVRARTLLYGTAIALVGGLMLLGLLNRSPLEINVLRDRGALFVQLSDGSVRNGYTIKILNKLHASRDIALSVKGIEGATLSILGADRAAPPRVTAPKDNVLEVRAFVTVPPGSRTDPATAQSKIVFVVEDTGSGLTKTRETIFQNGPVPH